MYFVAVATDYDGTIAHHGMVDADTISPLARLRASGRHLILVTGRELPDLRRVLADLTLFDRVVVENGALLYVPETDEERALAPEPPATLVQRLREAQVEPLSVGRSIIATWEPNETIVLEAIRDLGLEMPITFNKGAVMVLPAGINKASGLAAGAFDSAAADGKAYNNSRANIPPEYSTVSVAMCLMKPRRPLPMLSSKQPKVDRRASPSRTHSQRSNSESVDG